jgi:hypothetical protein
MKTVSPAAAVRVFGVDLLFVPLWLALVVFVFAGLRVLSVLLVLFRGDPWDQKTFFDYLSDAGMAALVIPRRRDGPPSAGVSKCSPSSLLVKVRSAG